MDRGDLVGGLALLGLLYGAEWALRHRGKTRVERAAGRAKSAGRTAHAGSFALMRALFAEERSLASRSSR